VLAGIGTVAFGKVMRTRKVLAGTGILGGGWQGSETWKKFAGTRIHGGGW
jgi:hypothetical protein